MTREHEYPPPPNASHEEMQPFPYGSQQQMPPSENPQHPPAAAANMQEDTRAMQGYGQANPYGPTYGLSDPSTPQQLAQRGLAVGPSQESSETRSKASRACDECRRKKVRPQAFQTHLAHHRRQNVTQTPSSLVCSVRLAGVRTRTAVLPGRHRSEGRIKGSSSYDLIVV